MKKLLTFFLVGLMAVTVAFQASEAFAFDYYYGGSAPVYPAPVQYYPPEQATLIQQLIQLIQALQLQLQNQSVYPPVTYPPVLPPYGCQPVYSGGGYTFCPVDGGSSSYQQEPRVETMRARYVDRNSAEIQGRVDAYDTRSNTVFFVYGTRQRSIDDIARDYKDYYEVRRDERRNDFMTVRVDSDVSRSRDYFERVTGLESDQRYYFTICAEYEDGSRYTKLSCGRTEEFRTDY